MEALALFAVLALLVDRKAREGVEPVQQSTIDPLEREALARVLASELASGTEIERLAIGWCVRHRAELRRTSIHGMEAPSGIYGEQGANPPRPFSSRQPPRPVDLNLAARILGQPASVNPWPGAAQFFEPAVQDTLHGYGVKYRAGGGKCADTSPAGSAQAYFRGRCYFRDAAAIRREWYASGDRLVATIGRIELWTIGGKRA